MIDWNLIDIFSQNSTKGKRISFVILSKSWDSNLIDFNQIFRKRNVARLKVDELKKTIK